MRGLLRRLIVEDVSQELVEYALLAASVAIVGYAALDRLADALGTAYTRWGTDTHDLWEMPDP